MIKGKGDGVSVHALSRGQREFKWELMRFKVLGGSSS